MSMVAGLPPTVELERVRAHRAHQEALERERASNALPPWDFLEWCQAYLPHHFVEDFAPFHAEFAQLDEHAYAAVAAPRDHAKSTFITLARILYRMAEHREPYILVVSDTAQQAKNHLGNIFEELLENDALVTDYPHLALPQAGNYRRKRVKRTQSDFITMGGIRVTAVGALSRLRGLRKRAQRPSYIVVDDVENDEAVENPQQRAKLWNWFTKTLLNLQSAGQEHVFVIGTILHKQSLLNRLVAGDEGATWARRLYRALDTLGRPLWPAKWSYDALMARKAVVGQRAFATEYLNDPDATDLALFKADWIEHNRYAVPPRLTYRAVAVDPSTKEDGTGDACGIVAGGLAGGEMYVTRDATVRGSPATWARMALDVAANIKANVIVVEGNQGGALILSALRAALRPGEGMPRVVIVHATEGKVARAEPVAVLYEQGKVHHVLNLPELEEELTTWVPRTYSPNRLDAAVWLLTHLNVINQRPQRREDHSTVSSY